MLEDEGDVARRRRQRRDVRAADGDRAGVGLLEPGDQPQRRGLAGAGRPEQHDELAVGDVEVEAVDRLMVAEALGDAFEDDVSHARPPS